MTKTANDHIAGLQAGISEAIHTLRSREGKLTQLDHLKLHSLMHNLRAIQSDPSTPSTGGAKDEPKPNTRLGAKA